jgi:hypothetical protein
MRARLSKIIAFRLVVGSLLLSSAIAIGISEPDTFPFNPFVFLIGVTFGLSILYLATLRLAERSTALIDLQFAADAVLVSAFIHVTGGITSHFSSLYVLPIIAASTVRGRRGAIQVAALGATLYTGIVFAQYLDVGVVAPDARLRAVHRRDQSRRHVRRGSAVGVSGRSAAVGAGGAPGRLP